MNTLELAQSKVFNEIIGYQNSELLSRIAEWAYEYPEDRKQFIDEYLQPCYFSVEWVKSKGVEKEENIDIGQRIFIP